MTRLPLRQHDRVFMSNRQLSRRGLTIAQMAALVIGKAIGGRETMTLKRCRTARRHQVIRPSKAASILRATKIGRPAMGITEAACLQL